MINSIFKLFLNISFRPCLSFDILMPESTITEVFKGERVNEIEYPLTVYSLAGSQADGKNQNFIYFMKWYKLHKTRFDDDSEVFDDEDIDYDEESALKLLNIKHPSPINRIRSMNYTGVVALWDERGRVSIYNGMEHLKALYEYDEEDVYEDEEEDGQPVKKTKKQPKHLVEPKDPNKKNFLVSEFKHNQEGFALQWNPLELGKLIKEELRSKVIFRIFWLT